MICVLICNWPSSRPERLLEDQKDDDQDDEFVDQCLTRNWKIIDGNGCSLSQLDMMVMGEDWKMLSLKIAMNQLILIATAQTDWMLILRMHCVQRLSQRQQ